jgi:hypothetical protein
MARACSTCEHPDRAQIEIGLANGIALRILGKRYGLDASQLSRHRTGHMPGDLLVRLRVRGNRSDEDLAKIREVESKSLLDHLVWQRARLYANADTCGGIGDTAGERAALGEASRVSERIGKLLGELGAHITINNTQINLVADPRWHAIRTELVQALRPFPAAWQATVAAIERVEQRQAPAPSRILEQLA